MTAQHQPTIHIYKDVDAVALSARAHRCDGTPWATILLIHGGGWREGTPQGVDPMAQTLARLGCAVIAPQYRLVGAGGEFPRCYEDLQAAAAWTREFHPDLPLFAAGGSAGGHLAALLATDGELVDAAACWGTPFDLEALGDVEPESYEGALAGLLGGAYAHVPEHYREASPAARLHPGSKPILLAHSIDDAIVFPKLQLRAFEAAEHIGEVRRIELPGSTHAFWDDADQTGLGMRWTAEITAAFFEALPPAKRFNRPCTRDRDLTA